MKFQAAPLLGAWIVELERIGDERGWFARTFDLAEFRARGMDAEIVQANASFNRRAGTLRGMHYQAEPHGEPKLVRCSRGRIFDVAVDLRPDSPTYCHWHGMELAADNDLMFYIPVGMAHGFQTLEDDCEVLYMMGHAFVPGAGRGVRFDDPAFGVDWPPAAERIISAKDLAYDDFVR
ncbi:MAG TPA: dTDP-4-dehydrorhamnose 3,5-epimerase [Solirubrobacteraceae bacterium]|nr:dTDP-4-dehydrorhamnose 3,5-epimerase [Solirubrobacteraceae bacterium]